MSRKRIRSKEEITTLAKRLRALWSPGEPLRPWLRRHAKMLLKLVHGGWSWEAMASAMEEAGIKYNTEKKWTATWLQSDFHRAKAPLKGYARGRRVRTSTAAKELVSPNPFEPAGPARALQAHAEPEQHESCEPEFQFARFIDWDEKRPGGSGTPKPQSAPPAPPPSQHYIEVMEQLTGKKPPY